MKYLSAFVCLALAVLIGMPAFAADALEESDTMSRLEISAYSNHTIKFKTPTGVDAATDTIIITFAAGFDLTSVALGDVDLSYGVSTGYETEAVLGAVAGVGIWGVSFAGQTITFAAPTDGRSRCPAVRCRSSTALCPSKSP